MMNASFMQQKANPYPTEMILKIRQISDLPKKLSDSNNIRIRTSTHP